MSTFQKRVTTREVNFCGKGYTVDFGKDETAVVFQRVQEGLTRMQEKNRDGFTASEKLLCVQQEEKALLKKAIGEILCCADEAGFSVEKDSLILYRDMYAYLAMEYIRVMQAKSPYSIERIAGYESFY